MIFLMVDGESLPNELPLRVFLYSVLFDVVLLATDGSVGVSCLRLVLSLLG